MPLSAPQIVGNIKDITDASKTTQGAVETITIASFGLSLSSFGPIKSVADRLTVIATTAGTFNGQLVGTKPFTESAVQQTIFDAFREFVIAHQKLLDALIGKAGLVPQLIPLIGGPMSLALRQIEGVVDIIAFGLIDLCQDFTKELTENKNNLKETIQKSVKAWSVSFFK